jgi:hypothetical protein
MGIKKEPARQHYWSKSEFLKCSVITKVMSCRRWEAITRCVHLVDNAKVIRDNRQPGYDKLAKCRWFVEAFNKKATELYNHESYITIDECIIPYKGKYCDIRMFLRNKPIRFSIKVWCAASSKSWYVSNMQVYMEKGTQMYKEGMGYEVVTSLVRGLENRWHTIVCDNLFTSSRLFHDLFADGFWATGTMKMNRIGLPRALGLHKGEIGKRGALVLKMHRHRQMTAVSWQDSDLVSMLSTSKDAWHPNLNVLCREKGRRYRMVVPSTPIQREYEEFMRGVDVSDHLRTSYSIQMRSHKWWHKVFIFGFDQSIVNQYILYLERCSELS